MELLFGVTRAHGDGRAAAADLLLDDRCRVDEVVEDDCEPPVDVGAGDLLEAIGARRRERQRDVVLPEVLLVLPRARVGDVVAGQLGPGVEVHRAPADLLELQRLGPLDRLGDLLEAHGVVVGHVEGVRPGPEPRETLVHGLVRVLRRLARHAGVVRLGRPLLAARLEAVGRDLGVLGDALALRQVVVTHRRRAEGLLGPRVVEHLELETRGAPDGLLDVAEALLVAAGHFDDDVLVARRDRGLAQSELVDAARDGVLGLGDGALADLRLDLAADLVRELVLGRARGLVELTDELAVEAVVDLRLVGGVLELEADEGGLRLRHVDQGIELGQLVAGDAGLARVQRERRRELLPDLVGQAVALVADRLLDLDRVDEAKTAAQVETGRDGEGDALLEVWRAVQVASDRAAGSGEAVEPRGLLGDRRVAGGQQAVDGGPEGDDCAEEDGGDEADLEAPDGVHEGQETDGRPDEAEPRDEEPPEAVEVDEQGGRGGRDDQHRQGHAAARGRAPDAPSDGRGTRAERGQRVPLEVDGDPYQGQRSQCAQDREYVLPGHGVARVRG